MYYRSEYPHSSRNSWINGLNSEFLDFASAIGGGLNVRCGRAKTGLSFTIGVKAFGG